MSEAKEKKPRKKKEATEDTEGEKVVKKKSSKKKNVGDVENDIGVSGNIGSSVDISSGVVVKFSNAKLLKQIVDAIKELVEDANINFINDGIYIKSMDRAHVALFNLKLNKEKLEIYKCDKNVLIGISIVNLNKVFKFANAEDSIIMKFDEGKNSDVLDIMFGSNVKKSEFELKLMNIDVEELVIGEMSYDYVIVIKSRELKDIISELSFIGDSFYIFVEEKHVVFEVSGDLGKLKSTITECGIICNNGADAANSNKLKFSTKYLSHFTKPYLLCEDLKLYMSENLPLLIKYEFEEGILEYYLAPKMDETA